MSGAHLFDAVADGLTIVADDLTGALDTAGAFAASGPVMIDLDGSRSQSARLCLDTDSRDGGLVEATARTGDVFSDRTRSGLWFKKVDSLLRGWPFEESLAAFRAGGFRRILFAPAFPDTGRITRGGRHFARTATGVVPVGPPLVEAFRSLGLRAARLADGDPDDTCDVVVADVGTNVDFRAAIDRVGADARETLFVGSGGLAAALGGETGFVAGPLPEIAICGTAHPVTLAQIARASEAGLRIVTLDGSAPRWGDGPAVLVAPTGIGHADDAARNIAASLRRLVETSPPPRSVVVTGGATLRLLLDAAKAGGLRCHGLRAPGIAVSTVEGGSWQGVTIVSKSGGFGSADFLLAELGAKPR